MTFVAIRVKETYFIETLLLTLLCGDSLASHSFSSLLPLFSPASVKLDLGR